MEQIKCNMTDGPHHSNWQCADNSPGKCQGTGKNIDQTIQCYWALRHFAREVCHCLHGGASERRLLTIYTCLILDDLNNLCREIRECKHLIVCGREPRSEPFAAGETFQPDLTSGTIFITHSQTQKIYISIANHTLALHTVRVKVLDNSAAACTVLQDILLDVESLSSGFVSQNLDRATSYEIQVFHLTPGMSVAAVETDTAGDFVEGSALPVTTFVPYFGSDCS